MLYVNGVLLFIITMDSDMYAYAGVVVVAAAEVFSSSFFSVRNFANANWIAFYVLKGKKS